jgi:hypothetical protein
MHLMSAQTLIYSMVVTLPLQYFAQINWVGSVAAAVPQKVIQDFLQNYFVTIVELLEETSQIPLVKQS